MSPSLAAVTSKICLIFHETFHILDPMRGRCRRLQRICPLITFHIKDNNKHTSGLGHLHLMLCSRAAQYKVNFRWMEICRRAVDFFSNIFLALPHIYLLIYHDSKNRWTECIKMSIRMRNNSLFLIKLFTVTTQLMVVFVLITSTGHTGCFVRCHRTLSLVLIHRSRALKVTTLVC